MKLTYKKQMIIAVIIIILTNIMTDIFDFWIYRSIGFGICGLIWIVHPVFYDICVFKPGINISVES